jgi:hypothetical protein
MTSKRGKTSPEKPEMFSTLSARPTDELRALQDAIGSLLDKRAEAKRRKTSASELEWACSCADDETTRHDPECPVFSAPENDRRNFSSAMLLMRRLKRRAIKVADKCTRTSRFGRNPYQVLHGIAEHYDRSLEGYRVLTPDTEALKAFWVKLSRAVFDAIAAESEKEIANNPDADATDMSSPGCLAMQHTWVLAQVALSHDYKKDSVEAYDVMRRLYFVTVEELKNASGFVPGEDDPILGPHAAWNAHELPQELRDDALKLLPSILIATRTKRIDLADMMLSELSNEIHGYDLAGNSLGWWHAAVTWSLGFWEDA